MQKCAGGGYQEHYHSEVVEEEYSYKDDGHSSLQLKPQLKPHYNHNNNFKDGHGREGYNFQYSETRFEKEQHHGNSNAKYEHYSGHGGHGGHGGYGEHHNPHKFLGGSGHGGHGNPNKFLSGGGHGGHDNPNKFSSGGHGAYHHHQQQYHCEPKPLWNAKSIRD